jgi:hypothetical protein
LHFLPPIQAKNQNRHDLTQAAYNAITVKLLERHRADQNSPV